MAQKTKDLDSLEKMRSQVEALIKAKYRTVEEFCWAKNVNKATMSNFLNNKKDFQVSTLSAIAKALNKKLNITLD